MSHITRYGKRMKVMMVMAMAVASFICLFAIPFVGERLLYNEVGYYSITIKGNRVGAANTEEEVNVEEMSEEDYWKEFGERVQEYGKRIVEGSEEELTEPV